MSEELEALEAVNQAKVQALVGAGIHELFLTVAALSVRISVIWDVLGLGGQARPLPADGAEAVYEELLGHYLDDLHANMTKPQLIVPNASR